MEMYIEINVVFIPTNTATTLQPMDKGVISTFNFYYLRNTLHWAIIATDSDSLMDLSKEVEKLLERVHHSRCQ